MLVLIDNYDSFTYNVYQCLCELGERVTVIRNDSSTPADIRNLGPDGIIISPGPSTPRQAGISNDVIRELGEDIPILGICLGHDVHRLYLRRRDLPRQYDHARQVVMCAP